ncbi:MAG TPA: PLP-dependent aminotransferase family protein [Actinomycetes bacterium]|nr:PLP-dependent aminotransferase family protein [Actinomycetes bacterium]
MSPELLLRLDRDHAEPLRSQLENGLREAIRAGRLHAGERLPSSRELAGQLGVSRGLVQECYGQLHAEGYLSARVGSATRVAAIGAAAAPQTPQRSTAPAERLIADFRTGVPDLASFPRADWLWAQRESCRAAPTASFDYGDPRGSAVLREVLAGYLRRVRAAAADPRHIVVCAGFAQGVGIVLRVLARSGVRRVAFEDPGYGEGTTIAAAVRAGMQTVPVPVDADGVDVTALAASGARAVVLTPAHQWPTGVVLTAERRHALVRWAGEHGGYIIEDDYDAEFRYDREPVGALQGLAPDRVIALGTVSKSLVPAIRFGWILCPTDLAKPIAEEKRQDDRGSPLLDQLTIATLIQSGRYDRQLRRMRILYAARRQALVTALARHAPEVTVTGLAAGFHAVVHLPDGAGAHDGTNETTVIAAARKRSVGIYGMSEYRSNRATTPLQLVLGFGNLSERAIEAGIARIGDLLSGQPRAPEPARPAPADTRFGR